MLTAQENRSVLKAVGFAGVSEYSCFATRGRRGGAKKRREDEIGKQGRNIGGNMDLVDFAKETDQEFVYGKTQIASEVRRCS